MIGASAAWGVYFYLYNNIKDRWSAHLRTTAMLPPPAYDDEDNNALLESGGPKPPSPALSNGKLGPVAHLVSGFLAGSSVARALSLSLSLSLSHDGHVLTVFGSIYRIADDRHDEPDLRHQNAHGAADLQPTRQLQVHRRCY